MTGVPLEALSQSGVPTRRRDLIVIRVLNISSSATIQFGGRLLKEDGTQVDINEQKSLSTTSVVQEFTIQVVNGWLLSFQVNAQGATFEPGTMYIEAFLSFGSGTSTQRYRTLFSGYLDARTALAWPRVFRSIPGEGQGDIRTFSIAQPAAGVELLSGSLPEGKYHFTTIHFNLVTDGTSANRHVSLQVLEDGGGVVFQIGSNINHTAGVPLHYTFSLMGSTQVDLTAAFAAFPFPDMFMNGDYELNTVTTNLQAGDRFSALSANVEFWGGYPI